MTVPDKATLLAEAAKAMGDWLEKTDPDFKGASFLIISVTNLGKREEDDTFDMICNDPDHMGQMLMFALKEVMAGSKNSGTINLTPTGPVN